MNFYERWILPWVIDRVMQQEQLDRYRCDITSAASGTVLEIGIGSGLNLHLYRAPAELVFGLDPSARLLAMARQRAEDAAVKTDLLQGSATEIPIRDAAVDSITMTWTLCSISDPLAALREMRRILRPGGTLHFVEHGLSPDPSVQRWQRRLTPLWRHFAGGCHLDRKIDDLVQAAGFTMSELRTGYAQGPRMMTFMYEGHARR